MRLGGEKAWTTVRFGAADDVSLGDPFAEAGGADGAAG
jgi:hypothetical protein